MTEDIQNLKFELKMSSERGDHFCNEANRLREENEQLKNALLCEQQLNIDLQKENEKLKSQLQRSEKNVFAELNQETADSNAYLIDEVATLQEEIEKLKNCANCKNCTSFDDISGLRIFECKEKTVFADSVCENWEIKE